MRSFYLLLLFALCCLCIKTELPYREGFVTAYEQDFGTPFYLRKMDMSPVDELMVGVEESKAKLQALIDEDNCDAIQAFITENSITFWRSLFDEVMMVLEQHGINTSSYYKMQEVFNAELEEIYKINNAAALHASSMVMETKWDISENLRKKANEKRAQILAAKQEKDDRFRSANNNKDD